MENNGSSEKLDRRLFLSRTASAVAGAGTISALSYNRVLGANDRISIGHIGTGHRGDGLSFIASRLKDKYNSEITAVCDLWKVNREKAAAREAKVYGKDPRTFKYLDDLLNLKDIDAVIISTGDFQHALLVKQAVEAGKDVYVEKPFANVLEDAKAARDTVLNSKQIVQMGTQHRNEPYQFAMRDRIRAGELGEISKIEMEWNYHGPRWRGRPEVQKIREEDTDWRKWLLKKPYRPFDPRAYFEFRLYKDFSSGIADQWMSHGIDLVHFLTDEQFPISMVANGGVFAWHDGRENPDTFQALAEYPKFLVSFSTSFGNDSDSFSRYMGKKATAYNIGGEGSPRWKIVEEKGVHEDNPDVKREEKFVTLPGDDKVPPTSISDNDLSNMTVWFEGMRSRKETNGNVRHGFSHAVAVIMAARAYREDKKLWWDAKNEQIVDHNPSA
jgi:predicted dehydrogenase